MPRSKKAEQRREQVIGALKEMGRARPVDVAAHLGCIGEARVVADALRSLFNDGLAAQVKVMIETRSGGYNRGHVKKSARVYYEMFEQRDFTHVPAPTAEVHVTWTEPDSGHVQQERMVINRDLLIRVDPE